MNLQKPSRALFRGAQRFLLVLLHDFPEFLSEYYFTIGDLIPPRCIQLRNVVLSAFPPNLTLPDPHMVDINNELGPIPTILSDFTTALGDELRSSLERELMGHSTPTFPNGLKEQLALPSSSGGGRYNTSLMNAVTLFVGATSVAHTKARTGSPLFSAGDSGPQLFLRLASEFDVEGLTQLSPAEVTALTIIYLRPACLDERCGYALAISKCTHAVVQFASAIPIHSSQHRHISRNYHKGSP